MRCQIKDLSREGVAVTALPEALPNTMLRIGFSLTGTGPSVLCDCMPVRDSSRPGNSWGLRFLSPHRDLPANLESHLHQSATRELKRAAARLRRRTSRTTPGPAGKDGKDRSDRPAERYGARRKDVDKRLRDLYRKALESLDLE
jgi:hypothetical protein